MSRTNGISSLSGWSSSLRSLSIISVFLAFVMLPIYHLFASLILSYTSLTELGSYVARGTESLRDTWRWKMADGTSGDAQQGPAKNPQSLRERMEAESRAWIIQCGRCGLERSVWDAGGVRHKAADTSRQHRKCPRCQRWSWHKV